MDSTIAAPLVFLSPDDVITGWSEGAAHLLGLQAESVIGRPLSTIVTADGHVTGPAGTFDLEITRVPAPGGGHVLAFRNHSAKRLREQLDLTLSNSEVIGSWDWDVGSDRVVADARFAQTFGLDPEATRQGLPVKFFVDVIHPDDRPRVAGMIEETISQRGTFSEEYRILRRDGSMRHVLAQGRVIAGDAARPTRFPGIMFDITARKMAESEALANRERYRQLFEALDDGFCVFRMIYDETGRPCDYVFLETNAAFTRQTGLPDVIGRRMSEFAPNHEQFWYDTYGRVARTGERINVEDRAEALNRWYHVQAFPIDGPGSDNVAALFSDITERRRVEEQLRSSESEFRTMAQAMLNHVWIAGADGGVQWFNQRVFEYSGETHDTLVGARWAEIVHPDDRDDAIKTWISALEGGEIYQTEFRIRRADGQYRSFLVRAVPVMSETNTVLRWIGTNTDIEHAKRNERALADLNRTLEERIAARTQELVDSQAALQQAQKMEAIGQLTGGVAHDFNNLLQVVAGNLQLLAREVSGNARAEARIENALAGVDRGAKLAAQLLAFGRRQALEPKIIDIGRFVNGMHDMLSRSLGDGVTVEFQVDPSLWNTSADPTQVENALLNLAINARDAMDGFGRLTISARNAVIEPGDAQMAAELRPGDYVAISVADTGSGIPEAILEKVFDPFFSTKPEGKGTGLGLSMVYGFVKQSGGHVKIESQSGQGTTITIFLPRAHGSVADDRMQPGTSAIGGHERILVVEDDHGVRDTAVAMLTELGYTVITANDATEAMQLVESEAAIDLIFTDVMMPGPLQSPEMARRARILRPNLAVLFTSGFAENSIVKNGLLDEGVDLLPKPYSREAMDGRIRQLLGRKAAAERRGPVRVMVVEDDELIRMNTVDIIEELGHEIVEARSAAEALSEAARGRIDVLLTDIGLPDMAGDLLAGRIRQNHPGVIVIFATGEALMPENAVPGSILLTKPYSEERLATTLKAALGTS